ncbi:MAG: ATP-dependent metallopeptidase FtsH/Yme1/Tma family protein [Proteobacteria bacterium]|nr:ATP-dependent metallopeptidase FtsH/Yme1/Tma family protein [Pseudomonadota bacterium]
MGNIGKNVALWVLAVVLLIGAYDFFAGGSTKTSRLAFSDFLTEVEAGRVSSVNIQGKNVDGQFTDGGNFSTYAPDYPNLVEKLHEGGVRINAAPLDSGMGSFMGVLLGWFPIILLIAVWVFFMRQMQGGGGKGGAMGFGKSRARMMTEKTGRVTFVDVAGIEEAKDELVEIVDFLRDPQKFTKLGGKIPKGCLLVGSPGTGKTLLARAIAGEANVPFFTISGSDFVEMFVGVGASRVRDMFEQGKKNAPCIIFIDEIDAVGRHRGAGLGGGNDEREQTLNQLLVEMDGFEANEGVIIIAATNRPDVLDPALLRPGRFDRQIVVPLPDIIGREKVLNVHLRKVPTGPDVDAKVIARGTPGFSGADLANLVNEAALLAARRNRKVVTMRELEEAKDKVMMGAERKSMVMSEEEKKLTAYHEAGHAIVSIHCPASDPIHKATIIPRGRALGMVMRLPERDRLSVTKEKLEADLAVAMGGRVAEELIFGAEKVTSGASSDIKYATSMARNMVAAWGMSDKIGPLFHGNDNDEVFLGHQIMHQKQGSEETANLIDAEVKRFVEAGYNRATKILKDNAAELETLAKGLLEYETLTGDEIKDLLAGKKIDRKSINDASDDSGTPAVSTIPKTGKPKKDGSSGDADTKPIQA